MLPYILLGLLILVVLGIIINVIPGVGHILAFLAQSAGGGVKAVFGNVFARVGLLLRLIIMAHLGLVRNLLMRPDQLDRLYEIRKKAESQGK